MFERLFDPPRIGLVPSVHDPGKYTYENHGAHQHKFALKPCPGHWHLCLNQHIVVTLLLGAYLEPDLLPACIMAALHFSAPHLFVLHVTNVTRSSALVGQLSQQPMCERCRAGLHSNLRPESFK
jgi:hypothetical protein